MAFIDFNNDAVMKRIFLFLVLSCVVLLSKAQIQNPVQWSFTTKKIDATTYEVHLTASIEEGWHLYSQTTPEGGPVPTAISFSKNPLVSASGAAREVGKMEKHFEPLFGVEVKQFSGKAIFVQTVKLKGKIKTTLNGTVEFMTCNDRECLPPATKKFSVSLN